VGLHPGRSLNPCNLAEDLLQTAFVRLHRHWGRVSDGGAPDAYLRRILVNLASRRWRLNATGYAYILVPAGGSGVPSVQIVDAAGHGYQPQPAASAARADPFGLFR
jgi:DNA-directed RNA polymerase specialized sigma24 family protein